MQNYFMFESVASNIKAARLFLMIVEEIGGRKDKGSHRKSRPPLGGWEEVDLEWGQKFGLAKKPAE